MSEPRVDTSKAPPDPGAELRITTLHATRGANYWSSRPITRMDLAVGRYEDISSADVEGFTDALVKAMPGLIEHRCSIGERGGFITRLKRGTYAPHIIEHIALELQTMIGHDVGYGRTRGGDEEGEYTLVFEHMHEGVGLRAAALALQVVQRAFAGALEGVTNEIAELAAISRTPNVPSTRQEVLCAVTGGAARAETQSEICRRRGGCDTELVVDVSPSYILQAGLPFTRAELAIVLDADLTDVPERYRDSERAQRLVAVVADAVPRDGIVICPAKEWEVQEYARDAACRVAIFSTSDNITRRDRKVARAAAWVRDGRILIEHHGQETDAGALSEELPAVAQVSAALAVMMMRDLPDCVVPSSGGGEETSRKSEAAEAVSVDAAGD